MDAEIIDPAPAEVPNDIPLPWDIHALKLCRYDDNRSTVFARKQGLVQKAYSFTTDNGYELAFRCTKGLQFEGAINHFIWLGGYVDENRPVTVCIDPAYIFERTACLLNSQIVNWNQVDLVPLIQICETAIHEASQILNLRLDRFLFDHQAPLSSLANYISLSFKNSNQMMVFGLNHDLNHLENLICNYCNDYWEAHHWFGQRVAFRFDIFLRPKKRHWPTDELAQVNVGDLLAIHNFQNEPDAHSLQAFISLNRQSTSNHHYEVFLTMTDHDTRLQYGKDDINDTSEFEAELPPHEEIELEIFAGHTRILFSDLCAIQEGSLLEISEHSLPAVTLRVMGSPILEGELVQFQDQIMIQVTRRVG